MTLVETPQQAIELLKIYEAATINEPERRKYYKMLREWLEESIQVKVGNVLLRKQIKDMKQSNHILTACLDHREGIKA